jgi:hypothetical protein
VAVDLVTETDQAVEEMIKNAISRQYKDHKYQNNAIVLIEGLLEKRPIPLDKRVFSMIRRRGLSTLLMV